jgi:hypothetical protein
VLDPLPRFLPTSTVGDDDLPVGAAVVTGESPVAARLDPVISRGGALARPLVGEGVRWVLIEHRTGAPAVDADTTRGLVEVYRGADLSLYRVPGVARGAGARLVEPARPARRAVFLADLIALGATLAAFVLVGRARLRRDRSVNPDGQSTAPVAATLR